MNQRHSYPQEFRLESFPPPPGMTFVRGDFISLANSASFFVCDTRPQQLREYGGRTGGWDFHFDLTPKVAAAQQCVSRPHLFNYGYFAGLMLRWNTFKFTFTVDALDIGLEELFGHKYYPARCWESVRLEFKSAILTDVVVTLKNCYEDENPLVLYYSHRFNTIIGGLPSAEQALAMLVPQFNRWRAYGTFCVVTIANENVVKPSFIVDVTGERTTHKDRRVSLVVKCVTKEDMNNVTTSLSAYNRPQILNTTHAAFHVVPYGFYPSFDRSLDMYVDVRDTNENRVRAWFEKIADIVVTLLSSPVSLPIYVMHWLLEYAYPDLLCVPEVRRLRRIQQLWDNFQSVMAMRALLTPSSPLDTASPAKKRLQLVTPTPPAASETSENLVSPETC